MAIINSTIVEGTFPKAVFDYATQDITTSLTNLFIYVISVSIYAIIIWHFYRHLGKRSIFKVDMEPPKILGFLTSIWEFIMFIFKSLILFPLITITWFLVLGGFLLVLSKSQDVGQILLMSMTVITSARITAYYNEDLSKDIAKLVPFALLGVFIVDPTYFSVESTLDKIFSLPSFGYIVLQYILAIVALEFVLRSVYKIVLLFKKDEIQPTKVEQ